MKHLVTPCMLYNSLTIHILHTIKVFLKNIYFDLVLFPVWWKGTFCKSMSKGISCIFNQQTRWWSTTKHSNHPIVKLDNFDIDYDICVHCGILKLVEVLKIKHQHIFFSYLFIMQCTWLAKLVDSSYHDLLKLINRNTQMITEFASYYS